MKDRIASRLGLLGILVLVAMLAVPSVSAAPAANASYFVPGDITASGCGDIKNVELWINTGVAAGNGKIVFNYDPNCANVTSATLDSSNWASGGVNIGTPGQVIATFGTTSAQSGEQKICDMTVNCTNCSCNCGTYLAFDTDPSTSYIYSGPPIPNINWVDGTYLCGDAIEVTKTVWDGSGWVDALGPLGSSWMGQDVRFKITATAKCMDLSNVVINDTMGSSLEYNNSATQPDDSNTTQTVNWTIGTLNAGASQSIEFDATIVGYGTVPNTAVATATVTDLGVEVQADDTATVNTMPPAGVEVTKTVQDGSAWVNQITGAIGETYRFRCEVENIGSPGMDVCDITVTDVLPAGLSYADNAMLQDHHGIWHSLPNPPAIYDIANNTYGWIINNTVSGECLQVGQKIVVEYDVTVENYGLSCNDMTAEAYCLLATSWVQDNDSACIDVPMPDLTVSKITVNPDLTRLCDMAFGPTNHTGAHTQSNSISADIVEGENINVVLPFNVVFTVTHVPTGNVVTTCVVPLSGMAAGTTETVVCNSFYPFAHEDYTINVTVDPANDVPEEYEGNNTLLRTITAHVHGLKGNSWQDGRDISTKHCYEKGHINLVYSSGDSWKMQTSDVFNASGVCTANWTVPSDLDIPLDGTTIKKARLYVYYNWDKTPDWNVTDYFTTLKFNGYTLPIDAIYSDAKHPDRTPSICANCTGSYTMCTYNQPYGMVAYNVTHKVSVTPGDNTAELTLDPYVWQNNYAGITGMVLMVVYEHADEPERIIWMNEGFDILQAHNSYGTTSEEATTYAPFAVCGAPIPANMQKATLITLTNHAANTPADDRNRLYFNGQLLGSGVWYPLYMSGSMGSTEIGDAVTNIPVGLLDPTSNTAEFQSYIPVGKTSGDYFEATNAILIVEAQNPEMSVEPEPPASGGDCYNVNERFSVLIDIDPMGAPIMGAQFDLHFNASVLWAETVTYGDFLTRDGASVTVSHSDVDNLNGVVSFAAARQGTAIGVTTPGTFAIVTFTAVTQDATAYLNLMNALAADNNSVIFDLLTTNGNASVCSNPAPVAVVKSDFTYNNIAERGLSKAYFNGTESTDTLPGTITEYEWWVDDGTDLVGIVAVHLFEVPMYWNLTTACYVPAEVRLTVIDDGEPMMEGSDTIPVTVWIAGDTNGDGVVNIGDTVTFGMQFGKQAEIGPDGLRWYNNLAGDRADLNNDEWVNIGDAMLLGTSWGHTAW